MKKKRKTKISKGGLYIALCGCAVVMALFGYVGKKANDVKDMDIDDIQTDDLAYSIDDEEMFDVDFYEEENTEENHIKNNELEEEIKSTDKNEVEIIKNPDTVSVSNKQEIEEFVLSMPVDGKVICEYSNGNLLYNESLSDWRAHNGIDISCDDNSAVFAAFGGVVSKIMENEMGKNVVIEHGNGYETIYSNLSDEIAVKEGDKLEKGDIIGKAGNSAYGDFSKETHLHFELLLDGEYIDPIDYIE